MFCDVVILAGGFGERLWPASSKSFPKQFLNCGEGKSFLQQAILRSCAVEPCCNILILTRKDIAKTCKEQALSLLEDDSVIEKYKKKIRDDLVIIAETCPKHTAAPLMLSCIMTRQKKKEDDTILVLTSDHIISPMESFVEDCKKAHKQAQNNKFVCFGIPPSFPAAGYGYIKTGDSLLNDTYMIDQFKEKPDIKTATKYIKEGGYFWNSGMFSFGANFFIEQMKQCTPEVASPFLNIDTMPSMKEENGMKILSSWKQMDEAYSKVPAISVDIAIAEKTRQAVCVKASFCWEDVGSWDTFSSIYKDKTENAKQIEAENNFVYSDIPVALCGVEDLIVVCKNGKALVMKKGKSFLAREAAKSFQE